MVDTTPDSAARPPFVSHVFVEAGGGRTKHVTVPVDGGPVPMGMHGEVAAHYRVPDGAYEPHATTLDYVVGAAVACLCGTLGGLLERLGQTIEDGQLVADGEGELVNDRGTLRIQAIRVRYRLRLEAGVDAAEVHRAHGRHAALCPVALSIAECIDITTEIEVQ